MQRYPADLNGLSPDDIASQVFRINLSENAWWRLERVDDSHLKWSERRLDLEFRASHGFLVALQEIETEAEARAFAQQNKISVFENGGLAFRSSAELAIRCSGLPPVLKNDTDLFRLRFQNSEANVGYASLLFQRLILKPAAETNRYLPDPELVATLAITNVDRSEVAGMAEICLFYLRENFPRSGFSFASVAEMSAFDDQADEEPNEPALIETCLGASIPEAIAFYNRAIESEPLAGFLYFYRVLEASFDAVVDAEVSRWRSASQIDSAELLRKVRGLTQKEDKWALRQVLGEIIYQKMLDEAAREGIIPEPSVDSLSEELYKRRNEIAHGRRGLHNRVLVPFGFSLGGANQRDQFWYALMKSLARVALTKWILK